MTRESHLELKVGAFVLLAILALSFFVASMSDFSFVEKGSSYQVIFNFANGLREAAPVRVAGVEAGLVKKMEVFVDGNDNQHTKVRVKIWLKEGMSIPSDSKMTINQLGLLGEKYIEIIPGMSTEYLKQGSFVVGKDPIPMERITEQVSVITEKLEVTIDSINSGLLNDKNKKSLEQVLEGFGSVAMNLKDGKGTLGKLLSDDTIFRNLEELTVDLKSNPWKLLYRPKRMEQKQL